MVTSSSFKKNSSEPVEAQKRDSVQYVVDEDITTLTKRMAAGDEDAYRRFFREYFPRLCAYANKLTTGDEALMQDVVQNALLRVTRHLKPFDNNDEFWSWLVLLLRCAFLDIVRSKKRYTGLMNNYAIHHELNTAPTRVSLETSEALHSAIHRLRPRERALLIAKYQDGDSYRDIASNLGISEKAVESRLSRLREKLKTILIKSKK